MNGVTRCRTWALLAIGLIAAWVSVACGDAIVDLRMNEGKGKTTADASANKFVGQLHGAQWNVGREGYGLAFDSGVYMDVPAHPKLCPKKAVTVEAWVKLEHGKGDAICKNLSYFMRLAGNINAYFHVDGKWRTLKGKRALTPHAWTHLAMTYDSATRTMRTYVNGALDAQKKLDGLKSYELGGSNSPLRIGRNTWRVFSGVVGRMDDVRISDTAIVFKPMFPRTAGHAPVFVPNGGFEFGRYGWRGTSEANSRLQWELDNATATRGRWSMKSAAPGALTLITKPIPFRCGLDYVLTADLKADTPGRKVTFGLTETHVPKRTNVHRRRKTFVIGGQWQTVALQVTKTKAWDSAFVSVRVSKKHGTLWIDNVRLRPANQAARPDVAEDAFGVWFLSKRLGDTYFADTAGQTADVKVVNASGQKRVLRVTSRLVDFFGKKSPVVDHGTFRLNAFTSKPLSFGIDTACRGTFRVEFTIAQPGAEQTRTMAYRYNVIQPLKGVGNAAASPFGMNTHMEREPNEHLDCNLEMLSQCGVKWIRAWWGWGMAEKKPGQFDWTEYDRQYGLVTDKKMLIMPILLRYYQKYEHAWAGKMDCIHRPPYKMAQWGSFVFRTVSRFNGRVRAWELWNEPQGHKNFTPELYAELCKTTYTQMRRADPKCKLVGFAGARTVEFIEKTAAAGGLKHMDILSEHSYALLPCPEIAIPGRFQKVAAILTKYNRVIPTWHTEQGTEADGDGYLTGLPSEAQCASTLVRSYICALAAGVEKFFWFSAQTSPTYGWAVFYEDYVPRPRLIALNGMASQLEGATFREKVELGDSIVAYIFKKGADSVAAMWNVRDAAAIVLAAASERITRVDMMGNIRGRYERGETVRLALTDQYPVYLRFAGMSAAQTAAALRKAKVNDMASFQITARRADNGAIEARVINRTREPADAVVFIKTAGETARERRFLRNLPPTHTRVFLFRPQARAATLIVQSGAFRLRETRLTVKAKP